MDIIPDASNVARLSLYNEIITVCVHLSKMKKFHYSQAQSVSPLSLYNRQPPPDPSDFCFIMKKSLYKRFYTKTPNSATFDVENGHHSPFSCHSKFRLAIYLSRIFCLFFEVKNSSILDELNRMWYPVYKKNPEERGMSGNFQVQPQHFRIFCFFRFFIVFPNEM